MYLLRTFAVCCAVFAHTVAAERRAFWLAPTDRLVARAHEILGCPFHGARHHRPGPNISPPNTRTVTVDYLYVILVRGHNRHPSTLNRQRERKRASEEHWNEDTNEDTEEGDARGARSFQCHSPTSEVERYLGIRCQNPVALTTITVSSTSRGRTRRRPWTLLHATVTINENPPIVSAARVPMPAPTPAPPRDASTGCSPPRQR